MSGNLRAPGAPRAPGARRVTHRAMQRAAGGHRTSAWAARFRAARTYARRGRSQGVGLLLRRDRDGRHPQDGTDGHPQDGTDGHPQDGTDGHPTADGHSSRACGRLSPDARSDPDGRCRDDGRRWPAGKDGRPRLAGQNGSRSGDAHHRGRQWGARRGHRTNDAHHCPDDSNDPAGHRTQDAHQWPGGTGVTRRRSTRSQPTTCGNDLSPDAFSRAA